MVVAVMVIGDDNLEPQGGRDDDAQRGWRPMLIVVATGGAFNYYHSFIYYLLFIIY